ncbi:hypothetical protein AB4Z22_28365, partial [Paenibacillus sp. TAF58]
HCKRGKRAYLCERSRISAFLKLILRGRAGRSSEKSIFGFTDSCGRAPASGALTVSSVSALICASAQE